MLLQVSESVLIKSAEMAEKDPHGAIITLVSVSVVFVALIVLYFAYNFIGKLSSGKIVLKMPKRKGCFRPGRSSLSQQAATPEWDLHGLRRSKGIK